MDPALKDTVDIAINLGNVINTLWQFYLTLSVAAIAWLLFSSVQLKTSQKIFATIGFLFFVGFNGVLLYNLYDALNAALEEVRAQAATAELKSESFSTTLRTVPLIPRWLPTTVHLVLDVSVVVLIWFNRLRRTTSTPNGSDAPHSSGESEEAAI